MDPTRCSFWNCNIESEFLEMIKKPWPHHFHSVGCQVSFLASPSLSFPFEKKRNKSSFCWAIIKFKGHWNLSDEMKASFPCCMFRAICTVRRVRLPGCWWNSVGHPDRRVIPGTGVLVPGGGTGRGRREGLRREQPYTGCPGAGWRGGLAACPRWRCNGVHFTVGWWRIFVVINVRSTGHSSRITG